MIIFNCLLTRDPLRAVLLQFGRPKMRTQLTSEKFNHLECYLMELAQVALLRSVTESITVWVVTERNS